MERGIVALRDLGLWAELLALSDEGFPEKAAAVLEKWKGRPAGVSSMQAQKTPPTLPSLARNSSMIFSLKSFIVRRLPG